MEWYVFVFIICSILILGQSLISFIFGDVDFNTDLDLDFGDIISFKGLLHFVFGLSLTLTVYGETSSTSIGLSVLIGLIFVFGLGWTYKYFYKLLSQEMNYVDEINNLDAEVYYWLNSIQTGEVYVTLNGRSQLIDIENKEEEITLVSGQKIKVSGTRNLVYKSN